MYESSESYEVKITYVDISYHSLKDKIKKFHFKSNSKTHSIIAYVTIEEASIKCF